MTNCDTGPNIGPEFGNVGCFGCSTTKNSPYDVINIVNQGTWRIKLIIRFVKAKWIFLYHYEFNRVFISIQ